MKIDQLPRDVAKETEIVEESFFSIPMLHKWLRELVGLGTKANLF